MILHRKHHVVQRAHTSRIMLAPSERIEDFLDKRILTHTSRITWLAAKVVGTLKKYKGFRGAIS